MGRRVYVGAETGTQPRGIVFGNSGTYLYVCSNNNNSYRYTCSTPYDVSTATFDTGQVLSMGSATWGDCWINANGTKFYTIQENNDRILQWTLNTAYDLTDFTFDGFYLVTEDAAPKGVAFSVDGTKMYVFGTINDYIFQYALTTAHDVTGTVTYETKFLDVGTQQTNTSGLWVEETNDHVFIGDFFDVDRFTLSTTKDMSTGSFDTGQTFSFTENAGNYYGLCLSNDGNSVYTIDSAGRYVEQYDMSTPWDVTTAAFDPFVPSNSTSFTLQAQSRGIEWSDDGLKFYSMANDGTIYEYDALIAYDIRGAAYNSVSKSPSDTGIECHAFTFARADGSIVFILDSSNDVVRRYLLSTSWDISSMGTTANQTYDFSAQITNDYALGFGGSTPGTRMYITDVTSDTMEQWTLTAQYSFAGTNTWVDATSISNSGTAQGTVSLKSDGLQFFIADDTGNQVDEYSLSSAWDMSSLSYVGTFSVNAQTGTPGGVFVSPAPIDGQRMWVASRSAATVYQYDLGTAWDVTTAAYTPPTTAAGAVTITPEIASGATVDHLYVDGAVTITPEIAGTGRVSIHADGAVTLAQTVSAGATNSTLHSAVAVALAQTMSATGTGTNHAAGSVTLAQTMAATGAVPPSGNGAVTITPTTVSTASLTVNMVGDATMAAMTADGWMEYNLASIPALTATGLMESAPASDMTIPMLLTEATMISGAGTGIGSATLPLLEAVAYTDNGGAVTLPSLAGSAAMISSTVAVGDVRLPMLETIAETSDDRAVYNPVNQIMPKIVSRGTMSGSVTDGSSIIPALTAFGAMRAGRTIVGDVQLPALNSDSTMVSAGLLTGSVTLPALEAQSYMIIAATLTHSGWSFNTESMRTSEYDNYNYLLLTEAFGKNIGVAADGIYELTGDTDNTVDIDADVLFGLDSFRTEDLKRVKAVHVGYRADNSGDLNVQIIVDGEAQIREYIVKHVSGTSGIKRGRATIAKGLKSRYWQYGIKNVAGADFMIDDLNVYVQQHNRKVQ